MTSSIPYSDSTTAATTAPGHNGLPVRSNNHGGVIDVLVNYWLTKIAYEDAGEKRAVPEYNLESSGSEALEMYLAPHGISTSLAIGVSIEIAGIVSRDPINAGAQIRAALAALIRDVTADRARAAKPMAKTTKAMVKR